MYHCHGVTNQSGVCATVAHTPFSLYFTSTEQGMWWVYIQYICSTVCKCM